MLLDEAKVERAEVTISAGGRGGKKKGPEKFTPLDFSISGCHVTFVHLSAVKEECLCVCVYIYTQINSHSYT